MSSDEHIPQPPSKPWMGNLGAVDADNPVQSLMRLAKEYGPLVKLEGMGWTGYLASSQELVNELSDESRFEKSVHPSLQELRTFAGDGLFTAFNDEPNWHKAHRILMPAFGPIGVRDMFDNMLDIAEQMFVRWERFGSDATIDVADNMTRLTLDTIALCAFDYRFNSFYQNEMHPFVGAMVRSLHEAGQRTRRLPVVNSLMFSKARLYETDRRLMHEIAQGLITQRRRDPKADEKKDLLDRMLNGVDPESGEKLSDENIAYQMLTFLVAGHETTSGLLSFAVYLLLKNPDVLAKARQVVDDVLGDEVPRVEHLQQLRYVEQILMETLRLWPTASVYAVNPREDTVLAGKYPLAATDTVMILEPILHRDPKVWGDDPEAFEPERFAQENAEKLPPNAWKPFGNGARACIGRPFAMQEAQLVLSMMLQRFDFVLDDPAYTLKIHEALTIKPEGLHIRAKARRKSGSLQRSAVASAQATKMTASAAAPLPDDAVELLVLYGSNAGSSQAFAERLAADAPSHGFRPTLGSMDEFASQLPKDGAVVVVTASYEGQPPDNARQFVSKVEGAADGSLQGTKFAVFGCGNRQWARTYQAIPKRVDQALAEAGAARILDRGEADSGGDFFGAFDKWCDDFWSALAEAFDLDPVEATAQARFQIEFVKGDRERLLRLSELRQGVVVENRELVDMTRPGARSKRHVEIKLPPSMSYRAGDYLAVLAHNADEIVDRVLRRFGLAATTQIIVHGVATGTAGLPIDQPISCAELLANYVELAQPATRAQVALIAGSSRCPPEVKDLQRLSEGDYEAEVLGKRLSIIDLLERFQSCEVDFATYLGMLPPMRARQYSISSSPLWKPDHVTLTVAVVDAPALSGQGRHLGVASSYLAGLEAGDRLAVAVQPSNSRFHPPEDPSTPVILICAGSGIAPFRGFLQERSAQKAGGHDVGRALLFFGATDPDTDYLYRDELKAWEKDGVVEVLTAFSDKEQDGVKFVQHRVWADRGRIAQLFEEGATVYLCGDGRHMAPAVRDTLVKTIKEVGDLSEDEAQAWADTLEHDRGRFVSDVFA